MREVTFNGKIYASDGKNIFCDGVLVPFELSQEINAIEEITALKIGDCIYYDNKWYEVGITQTINK